MSDSTRPTPNGGSPVHRPVLVREVVQFLDLAPGLIVVDGTLGAGGHSRLILEQLGPHGKLIGLDRDPLMLARAAPVLADPRCILKQASYAQLPEVLDELGIGCVDRVLLDLGLSSDQLADPERGFSFQGAAPLDMRFDSSQGQPAAELLASLSEADLADIFSRYGEEPAARAIAHAIVERRANRPLRTSADLVDAVAAGLAHGTRRRPESHPATRVFQALRIAVNHELDHLQTALSASLPRRLIAGGRAVLITFHSLEDRLVKDAFRDQTLWQNLTRKPVTARAAEQRMNPRCRTAKLRAAVRTEAPTAPPQPTGESPTRTTNLR
ncbi:MAG TPA: 16S rRNA (cytosine(1402)-N(4))-methyltransferase RsmH [Planctomycetaceae bacterium]|nr:16S rRNA (cytosine(1402)-N(4))-methyltransferase RsmH [Planctomycetaceae bacterium]